MLKFQPSQLFDGRHIMPDGTVLVMHTDGRVAGMVAAEDAGDGVRQLEGLLCPGFIDAHGHLELSHMRGSIAQGIGMVPFLQQVLFNRQAPEALMQHAMHAACDEMSGHGIVAVGDICNTDISLAIKPTHGLQWHHFVEGSGFVPEGASRRMTQVAAVAASFYAHFSSAQVSITPHAPYSVSQVLLQTMAAQHPPIMSIHHQESIAEDDFLRSAKGDMLDLFAALGIDIGFFAATGKSSTHWLLPLLPADQALLLVHHCTTSEQDMDYILDRFQEVSFCCCPNANLYIGNPLPDLRMMQRKHARICLGTDSLASNTTLSILHEMQTLQRHFGFTAAEMLPWATLNGAQALRMDDRLGSFDVGKTPGVLLLEQAQDGDLQQATVLRLL